MAIKKKTTKKKATKKKATKKKVAKETDIIKDEKPKLIVSSDFLKGDDSPAQTEETLGLEHADKLGSSNRPEDNPKKLSDEFNADDEQDPNQEFGYGWDYNDNFDDAEKLASEDEVFDEDAEYASQKKVVKD